MPATRVPDRINLTNGRCIYYSRGGRWLMDSLEGGEPDFLEADRICSRCGMEEPLWSVRSGIERNQEVYCCTGCAENTVCTCREPVALVNGGTMTSEGMENRRDDVLKGLIVDELSAVETYRQAIEKFSELPEADTLRKVENEHEDAVRALKLEYISDDVPESSGVWGAFAEAVTGTAKAFGNKAVFKALKEGEEHGVKDYERALNDEDLESEFKQLIRKTLLPQTQAHVPVLDRLLRM